MKEKTVIYIDGAVKREALRLGFNISLVTENVLRGLVAAVQHPGGVSLQTAKAAPGNIPKTVNWTAYRKWLEKNYRPVTARDRFNYAKKYYKCLLQGNLSRLRNLSTDKKNHVIKALSALSKFLGINKYWKEIKENYGIKYKVETDRLIIQRLTSVKTPEDLFKWIKTVKKKCPKIALFMDFMATTGLRFNEAINSWNLIIKLARKGQLKKYYNEKKGTLEHFRFKDMFIRKSKKVFISFVPPNMIHIISKNEPLNPWGVRSSLRWKKIPQRFSDIRELQGSILTKHLKESEINFIHGRIGSSTFMKNYFNPAWISDLKKRTLQAEKEILEKIR